SHPAPPTSPPPSPAPPTYSSPATPTGCGLPFPSSTYAVVFPIARPIGTPFALSSTSPIRHVVENVVFSVGPYPFINATCGCLCLIRLTAPTPSASPPASSCFNPPRSSTL